MQRLREEATAEGRCVLLWPGVIVFIALMMIHAAEVAAGLDFRDYDDLVRTVLARIWVRDPYFMIGDGYWPTLPAITRGAVLGVFAPIALPHPGFALFLIRLVNIVMMWGCWRMLAGIVRLLGGGRIAVLLLSSFFVFNGGTIHFAASAYSEPDAFFYFLLALCLTLWRMKEFHKEPQRTHKEPQRRNRRWGVSLLRTGNACFLIGLALAAGCLTRYEAWTFPVVFTAVVLWTGRGQMGAAWRRPGLFTDPHPKNHRQEEKQLHKEPQRTHKGPRRRNPTLMAPVFVLLPTCIAIGVWLAFQYQRFGNPFHFLEIGRGYNHLGASLENLGGSMQLTARKFLALHPVWVPLVFIFGAAEVWRRRREPPIITLAIFTIMVFFWALYRLWGIYWMVRYNWDAMALLAVPAALGLERWLRKRRRGSVIAAGFTLVNFAVFIWLFARLDVYASPELRRFAREVQRQTQGNILLCDHLDFAQAPDLQLFRLTIQNERLVQSDWIGGPITREEMHKREIGYVLGRQARGELTMVEAMLGEPGSGWFLWGVKEPE